ncbi:dienelactone hydrolase family protein [Acidimicrobiaceae bacterium]|nr:dienelactone hydrolase family protein [Acidimicrobiaceae bacterium]
MSFFDVAILLFTLELIFNRYVSEKVFLYSLYLAVITAIAQIFTVGYKWQYMPIYFLICLYAVKYTFNFSFSNKLLKITSGLIIGFTFIVSFLVIYFLPIPEFSIENKKYSVGYEEIYINIETRPQPLAFVEISNLSENTNRELLVDIYYPSNDKTEPNQLFRNVSTNWGETVINYLNRTWNINLPSYIFNHLNLSYLDVGVGLDPINGELPVVIYTHGWSGEKIFATDQLINIASQGYIVIAIDHTGLAMFTELPSGTIFNTGSTEASTKVFDVMKEMSLDIQNTLNHVENLKYKINFDDVSIIGHSTGGGSAYLYCQSNKCSTLILQDPFFVPIIEVLNNIELNSKTYFIYSQDWYVGNDEENSISEIEVYRNFTKNKEFAEGYYMTDSAHYDFVAFGTISQLTKYTFLKGTIDYKDSLQTNNYFNITALRNEIVVENDFLKLIEE